MINKLHMAMIGLYHGDAKRIQHFCKVHSYAKLIAEMENVDAKTLFILETAALTHDIGIHLCEEKYGNCNGKLQEKEGPAIAEKLLHQCTPVAVAEALSPLTALTSKKRQKMLDDYKEMRAILGDGDAAENTARLIIDDLHARHARKG